MLAHDRLRSRPFPIFNRVNDNAVMILRNDQDLMRFRQHGLRHHKAAG